MLSISKIFFDGAVEYTKNFEVEKFRKPNQKDRAQDPENSNNDMYRSKKLADGTVLTFAIKTKTGKRGGTTSLVNIKRPK